MQVFDEAAQTQGFAHDDAPGFFEVFTSLVDAVHQRFTQAGDGGQGSCQVMGDIHDEFAPPVFLLAQLFYVAFKPVGHLINGMGKLSQLAARIGLDTRAVIS